MKKLLASAALLLCLGTVPSFAQTSVSYRLATYRGVPIVCGESYVVDTWVIAKLTAPDSFGWRSAVWTWEEGEPQRKFDRDEGHGSHDFAWFPQPDQVGEPYLWRVKFWQGNSGPFLFDCTFTITRV